MSRIFRSAFLDLRQFLFQSGEGFVQLRIVLREMQHLRHFLAGFTRGARISHRQRLLDRIRGKERVFIRLAGLCEEIDAESIDRIAGSGGIRCMKRNGKREEQGWQEGGFHPGAFHEPSQ